MLDLGITKVSLVPVMEIQMTVLSSQIRIGRNSVQTPLGGEKTIVQDKLHALAQFSFISTVFVCKRFPLN